MNNSRSTKEVCTMMKQQAAPPRQRSMKLATVTRGKVELPPKVIIFGTEGCGKTTWASMAPTPIFLCAEAGTNQIDVARFPEPQTWLDAVDAIEELTTEQHEYQTLVVDTLDALEGLCWDYICKRDGKANIEDYGYMKGQNSIALNEWRIFASRLERLNRERKMAIILISHCWVKTFKNPEDEDYDRYEMKLHPKASGLLREWADAVLFARFETFANKDSKTKRVRGVSSGDRVVHTNRTAAYDAKNRYGLPERMPLDWQLFADAIAAQRPADPVALILRIDDMLVELAQVDPNADRETRVRADVEAANGDAVRLARIADRVSATLNLKTQEKAQ